LRPAAQRRQRDGAEVRLARPAPADGVRRQPISVVVAELRGLNVASGKTPSAESILLLRELCSALTDVAVERRASIDELSGLSFRFLFGIPDAARDDPVRALLAALAVQRAFLGLRNQWLRQARRAAGDLVIGVGVASGTVRVHPTAGRESLSTVCGRPLTRAAELGTLARPLEVLVDAPMLGNIGPGLDEQVKFTPRRVRARRTPPSIAYAARSRRSWLRLVVTGDR
jgi:class 3 adenylate cyclase